MSNAAVWTVAIVVLLAQAAAAFTVPTPTELTIDSGPIIGLIDPNVNARYFKGIPYAGSAAGEFRFKPTQPVQPWTKPLNCTAFGPVLLCGSL
jgi:hypothetical protein